MLAVTKTSSSASCYLFRAVYADADIYLLDDPLSAVDSHVSRHLFEDCIMKHLKHKVRILVTHQLQYLSSASEILVLKEVCAYIFTVFGTISQSKMLNDYSCFINLEQLK